MADAKIDNNNHLFDQRLDALESRHVFQDDVIEQLNQELAVHQGQIADLKYQIQLLTNRVKEAGSPAADKSDPGHELPPHY
jgi:SlyX protein